MKWWYHLIAAAIGFALAAGIVFLVFGRADQNTGVEGAAPTAQQQASATDACGSVQPSQVVDPRTIARAGKNLPTIQVDGKEVIPGKADQVAWFARLEAASGLCTDEIDMTDKIITVNTSYPAGTPTSSVAAFSYAVLTRSFAPPLNRDIVKVDAEVGNTHRIVALTASAWKTFNRARALHHLDQSIDGIKASRKRVDYRKSLIIQGW